MKTLQSVPQSITREQYLSLVELVGLDPKKLRRLEFVPAEIRAEVLKAANPVEDHLSYGIADAHIDRLVIEADQPLIEKLTAALGAMGFLPNDVRRIEFGANGIYVEVYERDNGRVRIDMMLDDAIASRVYVPVR